MRDKLMDTQELDEIRKLIGDTSGDAPAQTGDAPQPASRAPQPSTPPSGGAGEFNLNDVLAGVSGVVDQAAKEDHLAAMRQAQAGFTGSAQQATGLPRVTGQRTGQIPRVSQGTGRIPTGRVSQGTGRVPRVSQGTGRIPQGTGRIPQTTGRIPRVSQGTGRVPQVSGRIPRVPGMDPREIEESLRATADEQARHLAELAAEEESEARLSRRERKRLEKARRAEDERALDREEEIELRNPREAQRFCKRRAKNLARRSIFVLILGLMAIYVTVAGGMGLPLPAALQYAEHAYLTILTLMILQFLSMFAGLDIVGNGIYSLFKLRPDRSTLVVFSLIASLVHGMTVILFQWSGWLPYCAVSILLLFAQMQEEKARIAGRYRAYKAITLGDRPTGVFSHDDSRDHVRRAVKYPLKDLSRFLREMERNDRVDIFERIYAPLALLASFVFAAIASFGAGDPTRFCWALSAILSIASPLGILCAFGAAYRNVSRKLLSEGAALPGALQAARLKKVKEAVLRDGDLFPAGSITIDEIRNSGSYSAEKLLAYAAAVTAGRDMEISRVLAEALREQYGRPVRASNVTSYESGGLSADIGADSVLVGTAAFLSKLGIYLRDGQGLENGVYVVINTQVAGEIKLTYHPTAQTYGAIHALCRLHIRPMIAAQDFNISPAMVEAMFEVKHGLAGAVDPARIPEMNDARYAAKDPVCALLSKDGAMPYARVQQAADKLVGALRSNLFIGTVSGICGMLLMFFLTFQGAAEAVEPKNVILYLILWYIPVMLINFTTRRNY